MYITKNKTTGQCLPCSNMPQDAIDFATAMPDYHVTFLPQGLAATTAWLNASKDVVIEPERPDPENPTVNLPAVVQSVHAGNTIDLDDDGAVLLKDAAGDTISTITGTKIQ